ncbi:unnamed protein product [Arabidopsis thaliana]|uniref:Uncharacterized protein n=1 Tax=Arabidopsis thaliana TaxID=3702 RepID=A0A5S9XHP4_ARATH|nr:unnamed protein product [Arabidopsis thaliana]
MVVLEEAVVVKDWGRKNRYHGGSDTNESDDEAVVVDVNMMMMGAEEVMMEKIKPKIKISSGGDQEKKNKKT